MRSCKPRCGAEGWTHCPVSCTCWIVTAEPTFMTILNLKSSPIASKDLSWETGWETEAWPTIWGPRAD